MKNKYFFRVISIFGISLLLFIVLCVLGILGIREKHYYLNNYKSSVLKVINFTVNNEKCTLSLKECNYKGYINVQYYANNVLYYSSFTKNEFCSSNITTTITILKQNYYVDEMIYIYFFIDNPKIWIFQCPAGEVFMILGVFFSFFFLFSIFIGCIYLIRDKDRIIFLFKEKQKFQKIINV